MLCGRVKGHKQNGLDFDQYDVRAVRQEQCSTGK